MESLSNSEKELKPFWRSDGMDWIADLVQMKKAIVVALYINATGRYYAISPRSYFPFTNEQHNKRFDNYYDCCIYAESIIFDWVKSLLLNDNEINELKKRPYDAPLLMNVISLDEASKSLRR